MKSLILFICFWISSALMADSVVVKKDRAPLRKKPSKKSRPIKYLKEGNVLPLLNTKKNNGYYKVKLRSPYYIHHSYVLLLKKSDYDDANTETKETTKKFGFFDRISYDFNLGSRLVNDQLTIEGSFGLNFYFLSWLSIREAVFYHQVNDHESSIGLDSSLEGSYQIGSDSFRLKPSVGAGYRIETLREGVPFAEGGLNLSVGSGFSVSLSAKRLFYSLIDDTKEDELVFSIGGNLAGGGNL